MRNMKFLNARRQRGITLIEVMIAIAIALVVAAIAIGIAVAARKDALTQDLQNQVVRVADVANSLARNGDYTDITANTLCRTGKLDNICNQDNEDWTINGATGKPITVVPTATGKGVKINLESVPMSSCVTLATNLQSNFTNWGVQDSVVNSDGKPASAAQITNACSSGSDNERTQQFNLGSVQAAT